MDQAGTRWPQDIEQDREGLCVQDLALPPGAKQRARLTFSTPDLPSRHALALRFYEAESRRDMTLRSPESR